MVMGSSHPGWRALVARFHSDGRLDDAFADHGWLATQLGAGGDSALTQVNALALQPDGKIVLAGPATDSRLNNQFLVARLSGSDGGFDPAFGSDGKVLRQFGTGDSGVSEVHALALQPEGRIIAAGSADGEALIVGLLGQPPAPPPTPPVTPPNVVPGPAPISLAAVSKLRLSPVVFAAANRGGSVSRRTGTTVSYVDSVAAVTTFTVLRPARGVRSGGRCLMPRHGRRGRACTRWVAIGGFRHQDQAGTNRFHFTGRIRHRKLAPGRYRLQAIPRFRGRTGGRTTTHFRITPS